jgi:phenylacetate-CoA ligase
VKGHTDRDAIRRRQLRRLRTVLAAVATGNRFYATKFAAAGFIPLAVRTWDDYRRLPFTTKTELASDQLAHPPYGSNLSEPVRKYTRLHQTSGTSTGQPLRWLDTEAGWSWLMSCWRRTFRMMGLNAPRLCQDSPEREHAFFAFSYGPFLGFWTAFEAAAAVGMLTFPGGGMTTTARLKFLLDHRATVLFCTPTYALHLCDVAMAEKIDLTKSDVRAVVVAGEPGGNIPAARKKIETTWGARVFDHYGLTEVGPVACEAADQPGGLFVLEDHFIPEVLEPGSDREVAVGEVGELVLTNLGRPDSPIIRYRTGDLVKVGSPAPDVNGWLYLDGGVIGRADDMIHVRGNNLYPSAIEAVVRRFPEVAEFRIVVDQSGPLADLRIEIETKPPADGDRTAQEVIRAIRDDLLFRPEVVVVPPGTLPRFEMKARRVVKT